MLLREPTLAVGLGSRSPLPVDLVLSITALGDLVRWLALPGRTAAD